MQNMSNQEKRRIFSIGNEMKEKQIRKSFFPIGIAAYDLLHFFLLYTEFSFADDDQNNP